MNDEIARWQQTEAIFHEALGVMEPKRAALLTRRCCGDTTFMEELHSLLAAYEAEEVHRQSLSMDGVLPGTAIGPYAIDSLIGRGGMGAVYRAHRADGQFEQQVAIKIIDMPLASSFFRERFRAERQMIAGLSHPYIAKLLDGGVSDADELYLVMEFIAGDSITDFSSKHKLTIEERLRLFLKVCEAVHYAHSNLIVHRDLKPDNILVVEDITPRLLDFGTAKIIQPLSQGITGNETRSDLRTFTPRYASPEQILEQPISIASDVYALGVLLYVLLTDQHPYELENFSTEELVHVICNTQPWRPSAIGAAIGKIDADLDSITLKALRKDPRERYSTVETLAADIHAYLDNRPVEARKGNLRYLAGKFARRNRLALIALSLLLATILAGSAGIAWQSHVANKQWRRAEARSADLRELSNSLLSELDDALKEIPGTTNAQKLLVSRVLEHLDRMAMDANDDRQTSLDLIAAYTQLGNIQGNVYYQNVGDTVGAVQSFDKAIGLAQSLAQAYPNNKEVLRAEAAAYQAKGESLSQSGDPQASASALQTAVHIYDKVVALPGVTPELIFEAAIAYETLGNAEGEDTGLADLDAATAAYHRALDMDNLALHLKPDYMAVRRGIPLMHIHLGNAVLDTAPEQALSEFHLALQLQEALPDDQRKKLTQVRLHAILLRKIGQAFTELGMYQKAQSALDSSLAANQKLSDADPKNVAALADVGRAQDALALYNEYAGNPDLQPTSLVDRKKYRLAALDVLSLEIDTEHREIQLTPSHEQWDQELATLLIRQGALRHQLGLPSDSPKATEHSLQLLLHAAQGPKASAGDIAAAADAELNAQPTSARDLKTALSLAKTGVELTHHREAEYLLLLAQAYHANGDQPHATKAAIEGLALLPVIRPGEPASRLSKLLRRLQGAFS